MALLFEPFSHESHLEGTNPANTHTLGEFSEKREKSIYTLLSICGTNDWTIHYDSYFEGPNPDTTNSGRNSRKDRKSIYTMADSSSTVAWAISADPKLAGSNPAAIRSGRRLQKI